MMQYKLEYQEILFENKKLKKINKNKTSSLQPVERNMRKLAAVPSY